jgi:hypothetical protein
MDKNIPFSPSLLGAVIDPFWILTDESARGKPSLGAGLETPPRF